jgi:hypothetical protein
VGGYHKKAYIFIKQTILNAPEYWLWSHNRWKKAIPKDLELLKRKQKDSFETKFN